MSRLTVDKPLCKDKMGCLMLFAWSVLHPCKTLGKQLKHPCFRRSPNASLRSFVGFASCKTSVRTLSSILAWSQGASLSALRLIFKSSAFEPPIISPARMPGVYAKRLCTMQSPPSIHNPSTRGRGLAFQATMPESERQERIRKIRHRALTKG